MGFGSTCTVTSKAPTFAVMEITAKTQNDMVPMEKLRAVAEKMASRYAQLTLRLHERIRIKQS